MKEIIYKLDFIQIKSFCSAKHNVKRIGQATDIEKIFVKDTPNKELLSKIYSYKELLKLNNKKTSNPVKEWVTEFVTETSPKKMYRWQRRI